MLVWVKYFLKIWQYRVVSDWQWHPGFFSDCGLFNKLNLSRLSVLSVLMVLLLYLLYATNFSIDALGCLNRYVLFWAPGYKESFFFKSRDVQSSHVSNFENLMIFCRGLFANCDVGLYKLVCPTLHCCL